MEILNKTGSKERIFEVMEKVNKVKLIKEEDEITNPEQEEIQSNIAKEIPTEETPENEFGGEEELEGGLADGAEPIEFDPKEILMGMEVEMEHTKDPKVSLEITMDHLKEIPDYYTRLKEMEQEAETPSEEETLDIDVDFKPRNVGEFQPNI